MAVYDEACELVGAHVRAAFWDKGPLWIGTDPADLERPHVEVSIPEAGGDVAMYPSPEQARMASFARLGLWRIFCERSPPQSRWLMLIPFGILHVG